MNVFILYFDPPKLLSNVKRTVFYLRDGAITKSLFSCLVTPEIVVILTLVPGRI